jgi:hypothetical protein
MATEHDPNELPPRIGEMVGPVTRPVADELSLLGCGPLHPVEVDHRPIGPYPQFHGSPPPGTHNPMVLLATLTGSQVTLSPWLLPPLPPPTPTRATPIAVMTTVATAGSATAGVVTCAPARRRRSGCAGVGGMSVAVANPDFKDDDQGGARSGEVAPAVGHPGGIWRVTRHVDVLGDLLKAMRLVVRGLMVVIRRRPSE